MEDVKELTKEKAISMLSNDKVIHTFRNSTGMLFGCDFERKELIKLIKKHECVVGGEACRSMNHGLVIQDETALFVECKEGIDYNEYDEDLKEEDKE